MKGRQKGGQTMGNLFKIAVRNLLRYKRRTLLTGLVDHHRLVFVIVFIGVSGSFKNMMIGQITDSMLGHVQIHRQGYMASIDNLPLTMNLKAPGRQEIGKAVRGKHPKIEAFSPRIKFGGMFSNFTRPPTSASMGYIRKWRSGPSPFSRHGLPTGKRTLKGRDRIPELFPGG